MAKAVKADYHEKILTLDDLIDFIPKMIRLQDEPIADIVCMPIYYLSKLAKDNGVTVCQVGEGADELFFGYRQWQRRLKLQEYGNLPVPDFFKNLGLAGLKLFNFDQTVHFELLRRNANGMPIWWGGCDVFTESNKNRILSTRLKKLFANYSSWEAIEPAWKKYNDKAWEKSPLNWMSYLDLTQRLPELLLMRVDKMSMGASLECRVPFLDHKFVELAMSIPQSLKYKNGNLKSILKKSVRGVIPDEFIDRKKQGFGVPMQEWMAEKMRAQTYKTMRDFCAQTDLLDYKEVKFYLDRNLQPHVWQLMNLALWWNAYIK